MTCARFLGNAADWSSDTRASISNGEVCFQVSLKQALWADWDTDCAIVALDEKDLAVGSPRLVAPRMEGERVEIVTGEGTSIDARLISIAHSNAMGAPALILDCSVAADELDAYAGCPIVSTEGVIGMLSPAIAVAKRLSYRTIPSLSNEWIRSVQTLQQVFRVEEGRASAEAQPIRCAQPPKQPRGCVERPSVKARIQEILDSESVCLVVGPRGCGKSVLAAQVFHRANCPKEWIDCSRDFEFRPGNQPELTVIEDLTPAHPAMRDWVDRLSGKMLVTTRHLSAAQEFLSAHLLGDRRDLIVELGGMTPSEAAELLRRAGASQLDDDEAASVSKALAYNPQALRAAAMLMRGGTTSLIPMSSDSLTPAERVALVLKTWFGSLRGTAREALTVLADLGVFGLTPISLATVLGRETSSVFIEILPLLDAGFVRSLPESGPVGEERWIVHESIRLLVPSDCEVSDAQLDRYRQYLNTQVATNNRLGFLTWLDIWISEMRRSFRDSMKDLNAFYRISGRRLGKLQERLQEHSRAAFASAYVLQALRQRMEDEHIRCEPIIAITAALASLPPSSEWSPTWATIAAAGAGHVDIWARAACIRAAALHWRAGSPATIQAGMDWLQQWITDRRQGRFAAGENGTWDVAAWCGALCLLNQIDKAIEFMESSAASWVVTASELVDLVIVINLANRGRHDDARAYFERNCSRFCDNKALRFTISYLSAKNIHPKMTGTLLKSTWIGDKHDFSLCLTLADLCADDELVGFAAEYEPGHSIFFPAKLSQ
jgi:hypothetical protein